MIPSVAVVHIHNPYWRGLRLWIPLFMLWIPVILLSPLILLILWAACFLGRISFWNSISVFWGILCALPGTDVRVVAEGNQIVVEIF
jgi:hypothetical protein